MIVSLYSLYDKPEASRVFILHLPHTAPTEFLSLSTFTITHTGFDFERVLCAQRYSYTRGLLDVVSLSSLVGMVLQITRKDKVNKDAESGTMVRSENLLPQQPPQAHTSSTGARGILVVRYLTRCVLDGNKCTEKVPTSDAGNFAESHDFATTHGSNIVIDETTERAPLNSVNLSEDIGPSTSDVGKSACSLYDRSTTEATSMNNRSRVKETFKGTWYGLGDGHGHGHKSNRQGDAGNFPESHDFATTHGSNIVIDETTERGNSLERQRIHELDFEPISEPELQLPLNSVNLSEDIGPSTGDVGKSACSLFDRSTTEATSMNNRYWISRKMVGTATHPEVIVLHFCRHLRQHHVPSTATAAIVFAVCQANDHGFGGIRVPKQKRNIDTKEMEWLRSFFLQTTKFCRLTYQILPPLPFSSAATFANNMCHQPLPPPLSSPSAKLMIMALEEYGYQSRRGIRILKKCRSSYSGDVILKKGDEGFGDE
ncbi:hypothetical protein Tco_0449702 [Tanacetum coccineum]